jgi:hypothetical protein
MYLLELVLVVWLSGNLVLGATLWAKYRTESTPDPILEELESIEFIPSNPPLPYHAGHMNIELLRRMAYGEMDEAASPHHTT